MKFKFSNKKIFLLSPERWGVMRLSKHHYAVELAERGNQVFFIEPPSLDNEGIVIRDCEDHPNIHLVSYKPVFRGKRFLPAFIFRALLRKQIRLICQATNTQPDVVWSFEPYTFENLKWFNASLAIFHPVDLFYIDTLPEEAFTADICFCFSTALTDTVKKSGTPTYFINHGLNKHFCGKAQRMLEQKVDLSKPVAGTFKVGYIGNLLIQGNDRVTMQRVVAENPNIDFVFWGQYEKSKGNLGSFSNPEVDDFISFLKTSSNVQLKGPVPPAQLSEEMTKMDMFWLCLDIQRDKTCTEGVNPHKILEYLSTGKPFVSHFISDYQNTDLFYMLREKNNNNYLRLFGETIAKIRNGEPADLVRARLNFAIDNAYPRQVDRIELIINQKNEVPVPVKNASALLC